jgi:hypothetical protein
MFGGDNPIEAEIPIEPTKEQEIKAGLLRKINKYPQSCSSQEVDEFVNMLLQEIAKNKEQ